ncbi:hypothetical protein [Oscillibacter valericigenes]|uniref:hypothetical protein n=1 Tax=Oscillibacter valericigenes TaxID=351091 RepID=UPI00195C013D|nr:hypothetical protein [Oscillibacter valericigenes]MBM6911495.1 hypothetical protein [Oscillibacter valericigenes]
MGGDQGKWISTLARNKKNIYYQKSGDGYQISWANMRKFPLTNAQISKILDTYFVVSGQWYLLGPKEDDPAPGGFGEFLQMTFSISPRYASVIAAVLVDLGYLESQGKSPVLLRKISP